MPSGQAVALDPYCEPGANIQSRSGGGQGLEARYGSGFGPGTTEYGRMLDRPGHGRPLVTPYSVSASIIQFPWKLNWQRNWLFRYYIYAWFGGLPIIYKIHKLGRFFHLVDKMKEAL